MDEVRVNVFGIGFLNMAFRGQLQEIEGVGFAVHGV
jgi:hypothetical protein